MMKGAKLNAPFNHGPVSQNTLVILLSLFYPMNHFTWRRRGPL